MDNSEENEKEIKTQVNQPNYNLSLEPKRSYSKIFIGILLILVLAAIGGGIYYVLGRGTAKQESVSQMPVSTLEPTPTPETLNRSEWSFEVLNGSGVIGEARRIAEALRNLGYQVVRVGNADRSDYQKHQFIVQKDLEDKVDKVIVDIKDVITIASVAGQLKDSTASARIILGKE